MADQSTNFTASNGEYRNPFYQGTFEDETIEQMERRLHWAAAAVEAERVVQNNKTATQPVEQGEPVAVLYADGTVLTKAECGDSFAVCCKVQTPLYAAPAPEAVQVEPVAWATRLYNTAYHAGHHDTVEGDYTHVYPQDMDSYHEDIVQEWLADNPQPAVHGEPVAWKEPAANWLLEKAAAQQALNEQYPEHAKCYPTWENWVLKLNWLADELSVGVAPQPVVQQPLSHDWDDQDKCRRCGDRDWYASPTCTPKQQEKSHDN